MPLRKRGVTFVSERTGSQKGGVLSEKEGEFQVRRKLCMVFN